MTELAYALSLGSNLGDRAENLWQAVTALEVLGHHYHASRLYETAAMYVTDQPAFLNMAVTMVSSYAPVSLLKNLKNIEKEIGRQQSYRHGPRLIDIDIVLCSALQVNQDGLTIPHTSFREREFVLRPLAEIAAEWVDPLTGKTVQDLLSLLPEQGISVYQTNKDNEK